MDFASVTLRRLGSEVAAESEAALESNIIEFCALGFNVDRFKGYATSNWQIDRVWERPGKKCQKDETKFFQNKPNSIQFLAKRKNERKLAIVYTNTYPSMCGL